MDLYKSEYGVCLNVQCHSILSNYYPLFGIGEKQGMLLRNEINIEYDFLKLI